MPKPVYILACEGVSQDRERNLVSIFNIVEKLDVSIRRQPVSDENGKQATIIHKAPSISVVMVWMQEKGDSDKEFEAEFALIDQSGDPLKGKAPVSKFRFTATYQRMIARLEGLPVGEESGIFYARSRVREAGAKGKWITQQYPLIINIIEAT